MITELKKRNGEIAEIGISAPSFKKREALRKLSVEHMKEAEAFDKAYPPESVRSMVEKQEFACELESLNDKYLVKYFKVVANPEQLDALALDQGFFWEDQNPSDLEAGLSFFRKSAGS